jgi:hypothetical protein
MFSFKKKADKPLSSFPEEKCYYQQNLLSSNTKLGDLTGEVYGGKHALPPYGFELVTS